MRFRSYRRRALADQVLALLGSTGGFPVSTRQVAEQLGDHLVAGSPMPLPQRPVCWPEGLDDPGDRTESRCVRCGCWHRQPVWRRWTPEDVRPLLARLAEVGLVERVVVDGWRQHYWRHTDTTVDAGVDGEVG
ncbi:MAG: hypothetical protein ACRD2C_04205 [Acidimicrobiales bacterium]